jgi:phosphopantothenoylcysteine decarboxylase/phosphopantothenate--cysteine ligase
MQRFLGKKILLGVSGGVAAYKSVELARLFQQAGALVQVVMTKAAQDFIGAQTFQAVTGQPVWVESNDSSFERSMAHIDLSRWADMLVIAPATANVMAKLAHGIADDLLSLVAMMMGQSMIICPAMNVNMWEHPATQTNFKILKERGIVFAGPDAGIQACGDEGYGRMREPHYILNALELASIDKAMQDKQFIITAGPTREHIDPIRFISNQSSGLMGYALAEALAFAGAKVLLISGPTHLENPPGVTRRVVESAQEMHDVVFENLAGQDAFIGVAAVSDYAVSNPREQKIKKVHQHYLNLELTPTIDILQQVKQSNLVKHVIGFAAETEQVEEYALAKLEAKADMIVANHVGKGLVFGQETSALKVYTPNKHWELTQDTKLSLSKQLVEIFKTIGL